MELVISLGQMDVKLGDPDANLATVAALTAEAAGRGSDIVVFPELWSTGYDLENAAQHAASLGEGIWAKTAALARQHQIYLLGSCLTRLPDGGCGNTAVLFDPAGEAAAVYSKIHLFRLMEEEQYLTAGDAPALVETPWGHTGLAICYDLRFPELFRRYALGGAKIAFVPAEWPHPRLAHWRTLLRARAIENQMVVVACNRVGQSKETNFCGHSAIIDAWGEPVAEAGETELLLTAAVDLDQVTAVRRKIPVFADRRPGLYDG